MARTVELLLTENVEALGIVGDVVKVRTGYARNFLLPRSLATTPSDELKKSLQAKRIEAEKHLAAQRQTRVETIEKLKGYELTLERSCNDQGVLYAGVTQQEIATALTAAGYTVRARDVRLSEAIKRIDSYQVLIKYETELETPIKLWVVADRKLDAKDEKPDMDFDSEGNLIVPGSREERREKARMERSAERAAAKEAAKAEAMGVKPAGVAAPAPAAAPAAEGDEAPKKAKKIPRTDTKADAKKS
jgi:large subunit ribosomal protein L9